MSTGDNQNQNFLSLDHTKVPINAMNSENEKNMHIVSCYLFHMVNSGWEDTDKSDQTKQP